MNVKSNTNIATEATTGPAQYSYAQVIDANPIANLICIEDGSIIFANKAAAELFGYSTGELKRKTVHHLFGESLCLCPEKMAQQTFPLTVSLKKQSKEIFLSDVYLNFFEQDGQKKINLFITNSRKVENDKEAELDLSIFLDNSEEYLLIVDRNLQIRLYNNIVSKGAKEKLGITLYKGMSVFDLVPANEKETIACYFERAFNGETVELEIVTRRDPGKPFYYQCKYKPVNSTGIEISYVLVIAKDITTIKENQKLVSDNEQRWRFALEGSGQGVWDWNIQTNETYYSDAWKKMLGFAEDEISHDVHEWKERLHPDDLQDIERNINEHLNSSDPYRETEYRLRAKDGNYRWILAKGMIIAKDQDNKPLRMIGTHTDITERKLIEEKYKLIFYKNPLPMWTFDRNTLRFLNVNEAAITNYGYTREEFLQMTILDIRPEEDRKKLEKEIEEKEDRLVLNKKVRKHKKKNGDIVYANIAGYVFNEGNLKHTLVIAEDITEKVAAEQKLKQSEKQYKELFIGSPLPSFIFDANTLRFIEVNKAAIAYYGYSKEEFLQLSLPDLYPVSLQQQLKLLVKRNSRLKKTTIPALKQLKKSGEEVIVDITSSKITYDGHDAKLVMINDITAKVKSEKEVIEANRRYQFVVKATSDIIWDWNLKTKEVLWTDNFEKILGWTLPEDRVTSEDELTEKTHPDDVPKLVESTRKAISNSKTNIWQDEFRFRKKDGTYAYVKDKGFIVRNEDGVAERVIGAMQDITEMKLKEKELTESNERYLLATRATSDIIYDWDVNEADFKWSTDEVFGWKSNELDLQLWKQVLHPDDRETIIKSLESFLKGPSKILWRVQYRLQKKDGTYSYILERGFVLRNADGKAIRMIGAIQDISEMKQKERELILSNERFELAAKAASEILWEADFENQRTYLSPVFQQVFGFEVDPETYYHKWLDYIHPDDREYIAQVLTNFLHDPAITQCEEECRHIKADGTYAHIINHYLIIRDEKGKLTKLVGAILDISNRKYAEQETLTINERFQYAANATSDIIWDFDIKNKVILWSDNYQKVMGWQLPANNCLSLEACCAKFHPEESEAVIAKMKEVIDDPNKTIWEDEFRYKKSDGSYAYVIDRGFIIRDKNGIAERMIGAMQDISERKYNEQLQSLELRVFEVSAIPGIHFHNVLKTLIDAYENLNNGVCASICLLGLNEEIEILAPRLAKEHCRQLRYFIEKQKTKLLAHQSDNKNIIVSSTESDEWKYGIDTANYYNWKVSWTIPVYHHNGGLLAFITVFLNQLKSPSELEFNALARLRNLLRILIVNHLSIEQLRMSTERYDNVLKATHDMVWDWNLETGVFYRNKEGVRKVYGITDVDSIQNVYSWMERIHPGDHVKVQNVINNILHATNENTFDVEYRFKRDDSSYSFIYDRGIIVRNKEGKPLRMIGAAQDITDRKKLEQELLQKELDKQKSISQATIDTQEEERREIGKELHDNVNQVLTTTKLYLDLSLSSPEMKDELIKKSSKNIIYVINEIRQLSRSLMDPSIGDLGLIDSINDLVDNINITRKLHVNLTADSDLERHLEENQKLMVFRIIQEAMNNTIKYAQATSVHISIKNKSGKVELIITDDGKGFNPETVKKGAGLKNIQNRVYLTNGKLQIDSAAGKGCKITINFPINHNKQKSN